MDFYPDDHDVLMNGASTLTSTSITPQRPSRSSMSSRRSSRVEKPRSTHNSPRVIERRKTTSAVKRFATLEDHWDRMFGSRDQDAAPDTRSRGAARPVSWHPPSSRYSGVAYQPVDADPVPEQTRLHASFDDSRSRVPQQPGPVLHRSLPIQTHDEPLMDVESTFNAVAFAYSVAPKWQQTLPFAPATRPYPAVPYDPIPLQLQQSMARIPPSEPTHPINAAAADFLPIQHPPKISKPEHKPARTGGKVLVGMGLYDPPDNRPTFVGSTLLQGTGKGLKLEETWQPPTEENNDELPTAEEEEDDDDEPEDGGSVEDDEDGASEVDELPSADDDDRMHEQDRHVPVNLTGQSFFFEDEDAYADDWWCGVQQQMVGMKYPSAQVAEVGMRWA